MPHLHQHSKKIKDFRKKVNKNNIQHSYEENIKYSEIYFKSEIKEERYIMFLNNVISDQMQYIMFLNIISATNLTIPRKEPT